jgi:large subunit ribosomal protein L32
MALPKRKISVQRGRKRRTHYKLKVASVTSCSQCGEEKLPHRICGECGYYGGREIINTDNN